MKEGQPSELRSRVPGVVCRGTPERTGQAGRRERFPPPVRETGRDVLQALDQGGEAPEGAEEDFGENPGYDQEQQEGERLHTRPPWGERFIHPKKQFKNSKAAGAKARTICDFLLEEVFL